MVYIDPICIYSDPMVLCRKHVCVLGRSSHVCSSDCSSLSDSSGAGDRATVVAHVPCPRGTSISSKNCIGTAF